MFVDPAVGSCAGIGKNSNALQLAQPRFQRAKFLQIYEQLDPICWLTTENMEMIGELTQLRWFLVRELRVASWPTNWAQLTQLRYLFLSLTTLERVGPEMAEWKEFEELVCESCGGVASVDQKVKDLTVIKGLQLWGSQFCATASDEWLAWEPLKCESRTPTCPGFPQYIVEDTKVVRTNAGNRTQCIQPSCRNALPSASRYDFDQNYFLDVDEFQLFLSVQMLFDGSKTPDVTEEGLQCFLNHFQLNSIRGVPRSLTMQQLTLSTCEECGEAFQIPEMVAPDNSTEAVSTTAAPAMPAQCANATGDAAINAVRRSSIAMCEATTEWHPLCGFIINVIADLDTDGDKLLTSNEMEAASVTLGIGAIFFEGFPACAKALANCSTEHPDLFTLSEGNRIGTALANLEVITGCEDGPPR
eukprot:CAMPEP_0204368742 /NCGR_PEP_ID=MMETSP0469-20131031/44423_1 /ASSEMBLY_ACC=CAM_ASM_000384 /TAXON_ID=2969 /ORGANISM="Oxyrrhis marina" /LENGTH=415 /DNA_ID=CAMNT_0051358351 /DNA_START=57 /DNA_END=1304 /DNA_ORIENTATION=-